MASADSRQTMKRAFPMDVRSRRYFATTLPCPVFSWNSSKNRYSPAFIALIVTVALLPAG